MKKTAIAPANIAFIKYWGKKDDALRLPLNASISMNLSEAYSTTTVEFSDHYNKDTFEIQGETFSEKETARGIKHLDYIRAKAGITQKARVMTRNTFPKGTGAAASASGFAGLAVAASAAAGLALSEKELTIFARIGSGSACRSIPDGFVLWETGDASDESYAYSLYSHDYWDLRDILVIVDSKMKKVSTTEGQEGVKTSPLWEARVSSIPEKIEKTKKALAAKDFHALGEIIEEDCLSMHKVMQTQNPPLMYWIDATKDIMDAVRNWRNEGLAVYFTIDAGPNVHLICEAKYEENVMDKVKGLSGVERVIVNKPARGAHLVNTHLF